jgi:hypothetical protein
MLLYMPKSNKYFNVDAGVVYLKRVVSGALWLILLS